MENNSQEVSQNTMLDAQAVKSQASKEVPSNENEPPLCFACKMELKPESTKCHHCGTSQSCCKRRVSNFAFYAGAVIALASLVTMGFGALKFLTTSASSKIVVHVSSFDTEKINFLAANLGSKSGLLYDLKVHYPEVKDCESFVGTIPIKEVIVEPSKTASISAAINLFDSGLANFNPDALSDPNLKGALEKYQLCEISYNYMDYGGSHESGRTSFHCLPQGSCI
ncbi:hypothetical protein CGJ90_21840 [Vibrio parahaemolyticus]|uniref:hypothetical protein n=1 Tax=Vibrio parahaemolyticus TaxID=670 RepID=UPI001120EAB6|nr:hypothetical protein [Vibrio parahaemolyticus]ELB2250164.1 hypothetical protein [Vibrio parahaemolyticus]TOC20182.1 hypothetical protein CGJ90_21840 [Vibrio parahaemolyticus]TOD59806.1 hypothetical protein CGJ60_23990 [Vibrio parahaemolyticus]